MQKTNSAPEARAEVEKLEALKKRAAKQAAKRELAPEAVPHVECTVLPHGDGRISMGEHVGGLGTVHYEEGETFTCALPTAVIHYIKGWVNFEGAKAAVSEFETAKEHRDAAERSAKVAQQRAMEAAGLA
jgi:hypothetical protein